MTQHKLLGEGFGRTRLDYEPASDTEPHYVRVRILARDLAHKDGPYHRLTVYPGDRLDFNISETHPECDIPVCEIQRTLDLWFSVG